MADLLPTISSDEDDNGSRQKDGFEEEEEESDDEMDQSFQFGGILGEDGGLSSFPDVAGWSYKKALDQIEKDNAAKSGNNDVPRMDVASLIAAKRKAVQKAKKSKHTPQAEDEGDNKDDESSEDDDAQSEGSDKSGSDDSESETESVDKTHENLEEDVLKTRSGKNREPIENAEDEEDDGEQEHGKKRRNNTNNNDDDDSGFSDDSSENDDAEEAAKAKEFFDTNGAPSSAETEEIKVFAQLTLSRPLLRGVAAMGFVQPTPIQAAVIPLALQGRDICASAVTGSGKTAAFLLPVLERLLHRYLGRTKALVLTPTRELAAQCVGMLTTFCKFTNIRAALITGGSKNSASQAAELRTKPEIVVATPGRLLDHVTNSSGVELEDVEFLVLDEADRLLDLGFQDEVHELIKACPVQRQTMLFSATMNTKVDELIKLSLKKPIRVRINDNKNNSKDVEVAPRLEQEFVRVRTANEGTNREAMLLALLSRTFTKQGIVFFDRKDKAHRLMILCGLLGIKCTELHGSLTQQQRLTALEDFRAGDVDILLATDLAARGLDIDRVDAVINFEMPAQLDTYIHRIGRTARAGRGGRSCTLIGEGRRHLMKDLIKDAESKMKRKNKNAKANDDAEGFQSGVIRSRTIPPAVVAHFAAKIESLQEHVDEVLQAEAVAKQDRLAEMEATRAQNIIEHANEIQNRPKKEWFATNKQREEAKLAAVEKQRLIKEKVGTGMHRMTRKKRRAREALAAMQAEDGRDGAGDDDAAAATTTAAEKRSGNQGNIKSSARAHKKEAESKANAKWGTSVHDIDVAAAKRRKKVVAKDASGDASLFDDEKVAFSSKKPQKESSNVVKSNYKFRGYDPDKKLGKKKGVKKFKSKAKYKRR